MEERDAIYIASEFFSSVVEFLLNSPEFFSVAGFEEYYSVQELDLLNKIKVKLQIWGE